MLNKGMRTNEDLVHEALMIIYEKYRNIEFERGILPWAYGVLDKVISGNYRTETRRQKIINNHKIEVLKLHGLEDGVEDKYGSIELFDEISYALKYLNQTEREIFRLKFEGHSGEEIQQKLGISRSSLDVSVFRGRKKLKDRLEKRGVL